MQNKLRVAVFISGRGSNLKALLAATGQLPKNSRLKADYPAEVVLVVSNRPNASGLEYAKVAKVPIAIVDHKPYGDDRQAFEQSLQTTLESHAVQFICLAGFMRLLTSWFVSKWKDKILNIHPALLPAFRGLHTHERAIAAGVRIHGATVHFVTAAMDGGPILARVPINVRANETPETLAARVLKIEHQIYPAALRVVAEGRVKIKAAHCYVDGNKIDRRRLFVVGRITKKKQLVPKKRMSFADMLKQAATEESAPLQSFSQSAAA